MDKSCKIEGDYHGQRWTTWFLWKYGIKHSDVNRLLSAVCVEKVPSVSIVFNWVQSFNNGKEIALATVHQRYRSSWFLEAIWKLARRGQCRTGIY
jgi:hypothetical protein